jgi:lactate 2-monooxygenase
MKCYGFLRWIVLPTAVGRSAVHAQSAQGLTKSLLNPNATVENYSFYSTEIYYNHMLYNQTPIASTNYDRLEMSAKYVAGGAGLEKTVAANRRAFDKIFTTAYDVFYRVREVPADKESQWQILPRVMRPVMPFRNLSTVLSNRTLPAPIVMAPVGVQALFHLSGELATSKVFGELGLPFTLSTASSTGFADVAQSNGLGNPRWYQLYWPSDDDLTRSHLLTAKKNGYEVLVVTVDTWDLGWRTRDLDRGFFPFIDCVGVQTGLEDPVAY